MGKSAKQLAKACSPSEVEDFKKRLKSFPRGKLEIGSTHVKDLPREVLESLLLSVAKNETQPKGPPYIGLFFFKPHSKSAPLLKKGEGL